VAALRNCATTAIGLLFGWITAANTVSLNDTLVELGLLSSGVGGAFVGALLLIAGAALASAVISVGKAGPLQCLLAYAGAVLWALAGVVVNQYDASLLTTGAALLSAALVATSLISTLRGRRPQIGVAGACDLERPEREANNFIVPDEFLGGLPARVPRG
jgi:hypothetical protein